MFKITDIIFNYSRKVNQHSPQVTKKKIIKTDMIFKSFNNFEKIYNRNYTWF